MQLGAACSSAPRAVPRHLRFGAACGSCAASGSAPPAVPAPHAAPRRGRDPSPPCPLPRDVPHGTALPTAGGRHEFGAPLRADWSILTAGSSKATNPQSGQGRTGATSCPATTRARPLMTYERARGARSLRVDAVELRTRFWPSYRATSGSAPGRPGAMQVRPTALPPGTPRSRRAHRAAAGHTALPPGTPRRRAHRAAARRIASERRDPYERHDPLDGLLERQVARVDRDRVGGRAQR